MWNERSEDVKDIVTEAWVMLKIVVSCQDDQVAEHFGHCAYFQVYETKDRQIVTSQRLPYPGHKPGFLPNFLAEQGAQVIMAGGMGKSAIDLFNAKDIEVIVGVDGSPRAAVERYLNDELKSTGSVCHQHMHAGEC